MDKQLPVLNDQSHLSAASGAGLKSLKKPELLSPAGSLKHMYYAFRYGADAVYAGQPRYSLRVRENSFSTVEALQEGIETAHRWGKQFFLASNILPHNRKVKTYLADLAPIIALKPDALIMADPGLILMVRERWPEVVIHLSVQANTMNFASVRFWQRQGIQRVILSRELSLEDIAEIRQQCPDIELEVFVHGALCIAYSGRCLLSGYFNHRDANQGTCTNACRWEYQVHPAGEDESGVYLLEEKTRPGEYMPIMEDEHGTYILNSKDLRAIEHVGRLVEMGIDCLKIEGRTKSYYYAARTAQVYRQAIEDAVAGRAFNPRLLLELEGLANRGYTEGFYRRHTHEAHQHYAAGHSAHQNQIFVGEITATNAAMGTVVVEVKNRFSRGDLLMLIHPDGNVSFELTELYNAQSEPIAVAPGSGHVVQLRLPADTVVQDGLLVKSQ